MYGRLRDFTRNIDTIDHLIGAAVAPPNTVTQDAFAINVAKATEAFGQGPQQSIPLGGSSAGYEGAKSAYIEPNQGGYQARPIPRRNIPPSRPDSYMSSPMPKRYISDYRRQHLRSVTRGLRALR